jgi:hypothetical protein
MPTSARVALCAVSPGRPHNRSASTAGISSRALGLRHLRELPTSSTNAWSRRTIPTRILGSRSASLNSSGSPGGRSVSQKCRSAALGRTSADKKAAIVLKSRASHISLTFALTTIWLGLMGAEEHATGRALRLLVQGGGRPFLMRYANASRRMRGAASTARQLSADDVSWDEPRPHRIGR